MMDDVWLLAPVEVYQIDQDFCVMDWIAAAARQFEGDEPEPFCFDFRAVLADAGGHHYFRPGLPCCTCDGKTV